MLYLSQTISIHISGSCLGKEQKIIRKVEIRHGYADNECGYLGKFFFDITQGSP